MAVFSKDNLPDLKGAMPREQVDLSQFGIDGSVYVRALTAAEEREAAKRGDGEGDVYVAAMATVDENGEQLFKPTDLRGAPGLIVRHLASVSVKLSSAGADDEGKPNGEADMT